MLNQKSVLIINSLNTAQFYSCHIAISVAVQCFCIEVKHYVCFIHTTLEEVPAVTNSVGVEMGSS